jgi:hypothetical protein
VLGALLIGTVCVVDSVDGGGVFAAVTAGAVVVLLVVGGSAVTGGAFVVVGCVVVAGALVVPGSFVVEARFVVVGCVVVGSVAPPSAPAASPVRSPKASTTAAAATGHRRRRLITRGSLTESRRPANGSSRGKVVAKSSLSVVLGSFVPPSARAANLARSPSVSTTPAAATGHRIRLFFTVSPWS